MKNLNNESEITTLESSAALTLTATSLLSEINLQVYNDLSDNAQSTVNVLEMIQLQFKQIHELNKRRQFLVKEISGYLIK